MTFFANCLKYDISLSYTSALNSDKNYKGVRKSQPLLLISPTPESRLKYGNPDCTSP